MSRSYPKILRNRKHPIERRLDPKRRWSEQPAPMLSASNIHFEMAERDHWIVGMAKGLTLSLAWMLIPR